LEIFGDHACAQLKITSNDDLDSSGSELMVKHYDDDDDEDDNDDNDSGGDEIPMGNGNA
jgi:hypothetical protein